MNDLGKLLRELRGKISLRKAAELTGISHSYIADLEKGYKHNTKAPTKPSPDTLERLSKAYDYSYEELMRVAGYMKENTKGEEKEPWEDPELGLWFKELQEAPEERREELKRIWKIISEREKGRKPGDKQGE